jgi:hypothetical protein
MDPNGAKKLGRDYGEEKLNGNFESELLECENYVRPGNKSGRSISFEGPVPFLLIDTVQRADVRGFVDQKSKLEYQLQTVDWSPKPEDN